MDVIDFVGILSNKRKKDTSYFHKRNPVFIQLHSRPVLELQTMIHFHLRPLSHGLPSPLLEYTVYSSLSIHPSVSLSLFRLFHTRLVRTTHVPPISRTCHPTVHPDIDFSSVFHRETNDERNKSRLYFLASDTYDCPPCFCIRRYNPP